jgi:hypothetical protein
MFADKIDVGLVQNHHFWRQQKNSVVIDFLVGVKAPAPSGQTAYQEAKGG